MATVTIRKLDDQVKAQLRVRAAKHGRSMEEEIREILSAAVAEGETGRDLYLKIRRLVEPLGGIELNLPPRQLAPEPPRFEEDARDRPRHKRTRRNR